MKKIPVFFILCSLLIISCTNSEEESEKAEIEKKVSKRDYSITKANSYSDLFLDSMRMEKFIADKKLSDSLVRRMRSFYNTRNYQFAWFTGNGLTEQARGFWNLHKYHTTYINDSTTLNDKEFTKKMDNYAIKDTLRLNESNESIIETELTLTQHFIDYTLQNYEKGYVRRKEMERFIPFKREDAISLSDSLIKKKHNDDKYFEDVSNNYRLLKDQLARYHKITVEGGWPVVPAEVMKVKKGSSSPSIVALKKRLQISGDLANPDSSQVFNDTLEIAIKNAELSFGYKDDGKISEAFLNDLNVPALERLKQIMVNINRMRWMPNRPEGNLLIANIPEFVVHAYEGNNKVFSMDVVVGKEGHNTMMFTGDLNQIVFSPYWNIPSSIVEEEILPAIENNPDYLVKNNMEVVSENGTIPTIRQLPGPGNSLGKVKFLFPNSYNIYFHDTPAKSLFDREKRAFSHGCIRLKEPEKMANYLLRKNNEWTAQKISQAMNNGEEKYVKLKDPVPVFISYYTAWVDEQGRMNFREDIYDHDKKIIQKMFNS
ncbi:MAG: L,D-transpeptidase family protein [Chitinophagaceae bacterium]|nr:L,D-transpeptidase family protein [Chitinophagaceae bacterium]